MKESLSRAIPKAHEVSFTPLFPTAFFLFSALTSTAVGQSVGEMAFEVVQGLPLLVTLLGENRNSLGAKQFTAAYCQMLYKITIQTEGCWRG